CPGDTGSIRNSACGQSGGISPPARPTSQSAAATVPAISNARITTPMTTTRPGRRLDRPGGAAADTGGGGTVMHPSVLREGQAEDISDLPRVVPQLSAVDRTVGARTGVDSRRHRDGLGGRVPSSLSGAVFGAAAAPVAHEGDRPTVDAPLGDQMTPQLPDDARLPGEPGVEAGLRGAG